MLATLALLSLLATPQEPDTPFARRFTDDAQRLLADGKKSEARIAIDKALERDPRNLKALSVQAQIALALADQDTAIHALHSWRDVYDATRTPPLPRSARDEVSKQLKELDTDAEAWSTLQTDYVRNLLTLARDYRTRKDLLSAIEVFQQILEVEPGNEGAATAIAEIRRTGGREVAIEDAFAGGDPTHGLSQEKILEQDALHADWEHAWTKETDNYRYRTDAGYLVLETSAIAMEQMNRFYRRFFHWKEDGGKTPKIEIRIFKSRDEYLKLGQSPAEWSGGHFTGDAVETFCGGVSGKTSALEMYRTLFHEAAHQFVSLTGAFVPGWLNEAYASFFEGCVILSNGSVKWNQVPSGRLFGLAPRMEKGWMESADEGVKDAAGEWATPERAPTLRIVVSGQYQWGPPWYAPTWGVVYFLYNCRDDVGRLVFRDRLHEFYTSFKRGQPNDSAAHFEEILLAGNKLSKWQKIDELDEVWRAWILALRDRETGKTSGSDELMRYADGALARGEKAAALELLDEAREMRPNDPDLLERCAKLCEEQKLLARAADLWRDLVRELELREETTSERFKHAKKRARDLDPLARAYERLKLTLAERGLALAKSYEARALPTMALEIARRMSASFSIPEALAYYAELAGKTGKSLARWRVAYDEKSLAGWAGGDGAYAPYGALLRAEVERAAGDGEQAFATRELLCDTTFDADFSLTAEMQMPDGTDGKSKGSVMGLCFGRKDAQNFHAVILHEKGFLDIATNRGAGAWEFHDHRAVPVGAAWHRLRIDVTGRTLDVWLDGFYLRSFEFGSEQSVRGAFGLITGPGHALYREIRVLARERFDPAARLERVLAMKKVASGEMKRQPGTFSGIAPPAIRVANWIQGEAVALDALLGKPVLLAFWTPAQEKAIPCAAYYAHLQAQGAAKGLRLVIVCDSGTSADEAKSWFLAHPIPGAHVGLDDNNATYAAYWIKQGAFGLPRVILIDKGGHVVFEGDPGLKAGVGWRAEDGPTFVDAAFAKLLDS